MPAGELVPNHQAQGRRSASYAGVPSTERCRSSSGSSSAALPNVRTRASRSHANAEIAWSAPTHSSVTRSDAFMRSGGGPLIRHDATVLQLALSARVTHDHRVVRGGDDRTWRSTLMRRSSSANLCRLGIEVRSARLPAADAGASRSRASHRTRCCWPPDICRAGARIRLLPQSDASISQCPLATLGRRNTLQLQDELDVFTRRHTWVSGCMPGTRIRSSSAADRRAVPRRDRLATPSTTTSPVLGRSSAPIRSSSCRHRNPTAPRDSRIRPAPSGSTLRQRIPPGSRRCRRPARRLRHFTMRNCCSSDHLLSASSGLIRTARHARAGKHGER